MVRSCGCLAATVHGQQGIAHIDAFDGKRRGKDVAKCAATCHITMVHETLARHTCLLAESCKDGC